MRYHDEGGQEYAESHDNGCQERVVVASYSGSGSESEEVGVDTRLYSVSGIVHMYQYFMA